MEAVLIVVVLLLVGLVVWLVLQNSKSSKDDGAVEGQVAELRRDLQVIASGQAQTAGNIQAISQSVTQRLDGVSTALRDGVTHSAQIASAGQTAIANELKNTREQIGLIKKQLGEVNEQSRGLSEATKSLEMVLGGAKTRGLLGEVTLQRMLEDSLPPSQFHMQYRFSSVTKPIALIFR